MEVASGFWNFNLVIPSSSATGIGLIDVKGDYDQQPEGVLAIDLAGTNTTQFDRLEVDGSAHLSGYLDLSYNHSFQASPGDTFRILHADLLVGEFSEIYYPDNQRWFIEYLPSTGDVFVGISPFSADFDGDGDVDGADLTIWQVSYGANGLGDADGDSDSDGRDFLAWQRQFGSHVLLNAATTAVPEPAGMWLMVIAVTLWRTKRRL